jgi:hypothetical protein
MGTRIGTIVLGTIVPIRPRICYSIWYAEEDRSFPDPMLMDNQIALAALIKMGLK